MTAEEFRRIALGLPEALEDEHMGHPDFRVRGKIFATLGSEDLGKGNRQVGALARPTACREDSTQSLPRPPQATRRLVDLDMIDATSERTTE